MRTSWLASVLVGLVSCGSPGGPSVNEGPPSNGDPASRSEPAVSVATKPTLLTPSFEVVQRICASRCAGPLARLVVFRDAEGTVGRIRFDGDLERCSHPPRVYFDAQGFERVTIPEEPVEPGALRANELDAEQLAMMEVWTEAETLGCTDVTLCQPRRTEGFRSELPCRSDVDCMSCQCMPIDRAGWEQRGGEEACTEPGEECMATNPVCCGGVCMLAR